MKPRTVVYLSLVVLGMSLSVPTSAPAERSSASLTSERILEAIGVREGSTVCEIGAGSGEMSIAAARLVGPTGRVYTSELGENRIGRLRDKVAGSGLAQITVVAGDPEKTNFPDAGCDAVFMRDVYHHFRDPASINQSISNALKPGGRIAVVDFSPPGQEASNPGGRASDGKHGVSPETVTREMEQAGLAKIASELPGQRWFMVVLEKPKQ